MWGVIGLLSLFVFCVFIILGIFNAARKTGKAPKRFLYGGIAFVVFVIALIASPSSSDDSSKTVSTQEIEKTSDDVVIKGEKTDVDKSNTVKQEPPQEAQVADIDLSASFPAFSQQFYALDAEVKKVTYDNSLYKKQVTWEGAVIETSKHDVYFYGKPEEYDNQSWIDISTKKEEMLPYTIIAEITDANQLKDLNTGDHVKVSGVIGSRGNIKPNYNWKLYEGVILDHSKTDKSVNPPLITKAEYDLIHKGMSYPEVVMAVGYEGELISEVGEKGEKLYTAVYQFLGADTGANAVITFQDEKVSIKAQFGLK